MNDDQGQGLAASPALVDANEPEMSIQDAINAHLGGGQPEATATPETSEPSEAEPQAEGQPEEPQGRAEQRIQELIKQNTELQQKAVIADQLQMFIASNPTARAAYEQAINAGYSQEQAQQIATNQQQPAQQTGQVQRWYGEVPQDRESLPDWDPYDDNVVREHAKVLIHDMVRDMVAPILQQVQEVVPFVQEQRQGQIQAENQKLTESLDSMLYEEIPQVKEDPLLMTIATSFYAQEVQALPPVYHEALQVYAVLTPQEKQAVQTKLQECVKTASQKAKTELNKRGMLGQSQQQPAQGVQRPFSESATNLVSPRSNEPKTIEEMITAHLNR